MRISQKDLEIVIDRINVMLKTPRTPYSGKSPNIKPNPRNYHLDCAYGGYQLCQMADKGSGARDVFNQGHIKCRELYNLLFAFIEGLATKKGGKK